MGLAEAQKEEVEALWGIPHAANLLLEDCDFHRDINDIRLLALVWVNRDFDKVKRVNDARVLQKLSELFTEHPVTWAFELLIKDRVEDLNVVCSHPVLKNQLKEAVENKELVLV